MYMLRTMGRRIPIGDHDHVLLLHPVLSFSILVATIAMISALCIRRKSSTPPDPAASDNVKSSEEEQSGSAAGPNEENPMVAPFPAHASTSPDQSGGRTPDDDDSVSRGSNKDLPLPPALKTLRESCSCNNYSRAMSRKIDSSLSMKIGRSMSLKNHDNHKKKGKSKDQDSVWKKTIILGEKCRPDDEDDTIIYDGKGNRISTYHKKTQSNLSLSRTSSYIDQSSTHGSVHEKD